MFQKLKLTALIIVILVCTLMVTSASAAAANGRWHLRAFGVWVDSDMDYTVAEGSDRISVGSNSAFGLGVSGEYKFTPRFGAEVGVFRAEPQVTLDYDLRDLDVSFQTTGDLTMTPVTLGLNVHLLPAGRRVDLYLAPLLAYVTYSDLRFEVSETFDVDGMPMVLEETIKVDVSSDVAYGAALGIDIPFSFSPWAMSGSLRYLATSLDMTDPDGGRHATGFDSLVATLGIRYSF